LVALKQLFAVYKRPVGQVLHVVAVPEQLAQG